MRPSSVLFALPVCLACSAEENHPPEFKPDGGLAKPLKCDEVRKGEVQGSEIWVQGEPAACAAAGLVCPVADLAAFSAVCANGTPVANCLYGKWILSCDLEAGVLDATVDALDGNSDAGSVDAAGD